MKEFIFNNADIRATEVVTMSMKLTVITKVDDKDDDNINNGSDGNDYTGTDDDTCSVTPDVTVLALSS